MRDLRAVVLIVAFIAAALPHVAQASPGPTEKTNHGATGRAQGAIVVATGPECRNAAKALARQLYADHRLRPVIDEATARALVGDEPAHSATDERGADEAPTKTVDEQVPAQPEDRLAETREVVTSIGTACQASCAGSTVARRLIASLGSELGARLVVVVSCSAGEAEAGAEPAPPVAQVVQVAEARFVPVVLAAKIRADGSQPYQWDDATRVLGSLVTPPDEPQAARRTAPQRSRKPAVSPTVDVSTDGGDSAAAEDDDDLAFLSSPWFWGGLGAVVAIGVTVFALSQTSLNEPDVIRVQGRVSP